MVEGNWGLSSGVRVINAVEWNALEAEISLPHPPKRDETLGRGAIGLQVKGLRIYGVRGLGENSQDELCLLRESK